MSRSIRRHRRAPLGAALAALLLLAVAADLAAQAPPPMQPDVQRAAMDRLAYMAGDWAGEGWMLSPAGRQTFTGGERVQRKLDGLALLVEGDFTARSPDSTAVPVHNTLGVISYDPRDSTYRFRTWLATGAAGAHELELMDDGWRWYIENPRGRIRYTATFTPQGMWHEIGEMERAPGSWMQFFEMTLRKR